MSTKPSPTSWAGDRLAITPVRAAMQLGLFTCSPDDPVADVARTMAEQSIHCVLVTGISRRGHEGETLGWGIVSDLDLMAALSSGAETATAGEVAGGEIVTVSPREPLALAAGLMVEHQTAHLVVVSPDTGRPVGMLSTLDVARAADAAV